MAKTKATKRVTREDLEYYFALDEERLKFQRQADDVKKLQAELETRFEAHVVAKGGTEKSVVTCGYRLYFASKSGSVQWKEQFLRVAKLAGLDPLEESERLRAAAPKKEELRIEPPPEPEG
jgi:hypothetical protein